MTSGSPHLHAIQELEFRWHREAGEQSPNGDGFEALLAWF